MRWPTREFLRRRWRLVLLVVLGVPALLLAVLAGVFLAIDYGCLRSSDDVVKRLVGRFDSDVAQGRFDDACTTLAARARRRFTTEASRPTCPGALRAADAQDALPSPPGRVIAVHTNGDDSRSVVRTSDGVYRLAKPADSACRSWRIVAVHGLGR